MLKGFEIETAPLSEYEEKVLLPVMVRGLYNKFGKRMAVKNGYICERLKSAGYDITEARVRKLISHIRINGLVPRLIASSAGYYISSDKKELTEYIDSLRGRELAIRAVREAMEEQSAGL